MKKMLALVLMLSLAFPMTARAGQNLTWMAAQVIQETNGDRAKNGLHALVVDPELTAAACVRAREIVKKFSHTRPNGARGVTASTTAKAENIAKGQQSAAKVMAAWMSSPSHKRAVLRRSSTKIGVCAYRENGIMYWVQLYN